MTRKIQPKNKKEEGYRSFSEFWTCMAVRLLFSVIVCMGTVGWLKIFKEAIRVDRLYLPCFYFMIYISSLSYLISIMDEIEEDILKSMRKKDAKT